MIDYKISSLAQRDLLEIYTYIKKENPFAARKLISELLKKFEIISLNSFMGVIRKDITNKNLRFFYYKKYIIVYKPTKTIEIARVLSGYRNLNKFL